MCAKDRPIPNRVALGGSSRKSGLPPRNRKMDVLPAVKGEVVRSRQARTDERAFLVRLTRLAKQVSAGNYSRARKLVDLTVSASHARPIAELDEAIGMMIVKVESREFKLEQLVDDLERSCKELTAAKKALEGFNRSLEEKIAARTEQLRRKNEELSGALQSLKEEARERKQAEKNLSQLNRQVEETNRELQDAYLFMRQQKDRWAARRYTESVIYLTADDGQIRGFTERALELTKKTRSELQKANIQDIFFSRDGQPFEHLVRHVRPNIAHATAVGFRDRPGDDTSYDAKLTRFFVDGERLTFLVLYEQQRQ